jgi:hypothetical protein
MNLCLKMRMLCCRAWNIQNLILRSSLNSFQIWTQVISIEKFLLLRNMFNCRSPWSTSMPLLCRKYLPKTVGGWLKGMMSDILAVCVGCQSNKKGSLLVCYEQKFKQDVLWVWSLTCSFCYSSRRLIKCMKKWQLVSSCWRQNWITLGLYL